jgi:hypothetical protein
MRQAGALRFGLPGFNPGVRVINVGRVISGDDRHVQKKTKE